MNNPWKNPNLFEDDEIEGEFIVQMLDKDLKSWIDVPREFYEQVIGFGIENPWPSKASADLAVEYMNQSDWAICAFEDRDSIDGIDALFRVVERNEENSKEMKL